MARRWFWGHGEGSRALAGEDEGAGGKATVCISDVGGKIRKQSMYSLKRLETCV